jgi:hypothetical protein
LIEYLDKFTDEVNGIDRSDPEQRKQSIW